MKLARYEEHSTDLSRWLDVRRGSKLISSVLIEVEFPRAVLRSGSMDLTRVTDVLRGIEIVSLVPQVIARAATYDDPNLRSLDAIHLATAEYVASATTEILEAFIAYDERLLDAARRIGLTAVAPGLS